MIARTKKVAYMHIQCQCPFQNLHSALSTQSLPSVSACFFSSCSRSTRHQRTPSLISIFIHLLCASSIRIWSSASAVRLSEVHLWQVTLVPLFGVVPHRVVSRVSYSVVSAKRSLVTLFGMLSSEVSARKFQRAVGIVHNVSSVLGCIHSKSCRNTWMLSALCVAYELQKQYY